MPCYLLYYILLRIKEKHVILQWVRFWPPLRAGNNHINASTYFPVTSMGYFSANYFLTSHILIQTVDSNNMPHSPVMPDSETNKSSPGRWDVQNLPVCFIISFSKRTWTDRKGRRVPRCIQLIFVSLLHTTGDDKRIGVHSARVRQGRSHLPFHTHLQSWKDGGQRKNM